MLRCPGFTSHVVPNFLRSKTSEVGHSTEYDCPYHLTSISCEQVAWPRQHVQSEYKPFGLRARLRQTGPPQDRDIDKTLVMGFVFSLLPTPLWTIVIHGFWHLPSGSVDRLVKPLRRRQFRRFLHAVTICVPRSLWRLMSFFACYYRVIELLTMWCNSTLVIFSCVAVPVLLLTALLLPSDLS